MHRQWLYQSYVVHNPVSGILTKAWKDELLVEIERQRDMGDAGLLEEDKYLAIVNLEEMAITLEEWQHYYLLAIQTTQNAKLLQDKQEQCQTRKRKPQANKAGLSTFGFSERLERLHILQP